ncbi:hypothetical protein RTBOTA2_000992 [Rhodotorula toruloides]|nr:hypothetical protein RTBOTA2_000992 [Rhodotorula toruloides]
MLRLLSLAFSVAALLSAITGAKALGLNPNKSSCAVVLENGRLVNVFSKNKRTWAWDYLPSADSSGGTVYLSETDSPEDGAWHVVQAQGMNSSVITLNLASDEESFQCIRVTGKNRLATTGACSLEKSQFTISCESCAPLSTSPTTGLALASGCQLRSVASPTQCLSTISPTADSPRKLAAIGTRTCAGLRGWGQLWDLVVA